ncbi:hypothetical protein GCM10025865_17280 [Paraoerskovia sediminicola]|uniref:ARC6 IMS domain-containing protein n=1 Tax=Paraoerskovia sediminicola TaxID=1138587 RepID=A0ABM8G2T4_9CELL|nr:hypothetical protein [Paraoerskovia sediminicola]BDZ42429.1 hypothetical protein GCM10025865_17280 [Paraoerskovia sediminicola]
MTACCAVAVVAGVVTGCALAPISAGQASDGESEVGSTSFGSAEDGGGESSAGGDDADGSEGADGGSDGAGAAEGADAATVDPVRLSRPTVDAGVRYSDELSDDGIGRYRQIELADDAELLDAQWAIDALADNDPGWDDSDVSAAYATVMRFMVSEVFDSVLSDNPAPSAQARWFAENSHRFDPTIRDQVEDALATERAGTVVVAASEVMGRGTPRYSDRGGRIDRVLVSPTGITWGEEQEALGFDFESTFSRPVETWGRDASELVTGTFTYYVTRHGEDWLIAGWQNDYGTTTSTIDTSEDLSEDSDGEGAGSGGPRSGDASRGRMVE